ncbi:MAG: hypothetical protein HLUCCA11_20225 [Phormidesmis priestleyi Ana]|uniref:Uncharacterized protein n=1 Tax=Phormidesmis priestleyi Ana TaxID=1666911 RepID=A0A0P7ZE24_9CYAN|nr:MAG: hypothetical protein HLUCCA11_20225 [Phormidesmis priestleyi Ana]
MKSYLSNQLVRPLQSGLLRCASSVQHLLMKAAVAFSLKLCLFTAKVLLGSNSKSNSHMTESF